MGGALCCVCEPFVGCKPHDPRHAHAACAGAMRVSVCVVGSSGRGAMTGTLRGVGSRCYIITMTAASLFLHGTRTAASAVLTA